MQAATAFGAVVLFIDGEHVSVPYGSIVDVHVETEVPVPVQAQAPAQDDDDTHRRAVGVVGWEAALDHDHDDGIWTVVGGGNGNNGNDTEDDDDHDAEANANANANATTQNTTAAVAAYVFIDLSLDEDDDAAAAALALSIQEPSAKRQKLSLVQGDVFDSPTLALYDTTTATEDADDDQEAAMMQELAAAMSSDAAVVNDDDVMEEVAVVQVHDVMEEEEVAPPLQVVHRPAKPTVCFWVRGVGLRVEEEILSEFMGGNHYLAGSARSKWNDALQVPMLIPDTIKDPTSVTHVQLDASMHSMVQHPGLMHVLLDYMCRSVKAAPAVVPVSLYGFPNGVEDVIAFDKMQHFLFSGQVFRSPTAVLMSSSDADDDDHDDDEHAAAAGPLVRVKPGVPAHPPFVQVKFEFERALFPEGSVDTVDTSRFAEICLVPDNVRYHTAQHPFNADKMSKSKTNAHFRPDVHHELEDMCFDPLFWSMVRERCDRNSSIPIEEVCKHSKAMHPRYARGEVANDLSFHGKYLRLVNCYSDELYYLDGLYTNAKRVLVERGVEVRVEAYKLQDAPGAQLDRVKGWDVGTGHRVVFRKEAEAALEDKIAKARKSSKRRTDLETELEALRHETKWHVL